MSSTRFVLSCAISSLLSSVPVALAKPAPQAKPASTIQLTIGGKPVDAPTMSIVKDGEICINIDDEKRAGVGFCVPADAAERKPVEGASITVHRPKTDGNIENLMGKGKYRIEFTSLKLGTWKAPGKCSGQISLSINDARVGSGAVATADGEFRDVACYAMGQ
jgi:hypothetical protein